MSGWDEPQHNGLNMRDSQILATGNDPLNPQTTGIGDSSFPMPGDSAPATSGKGGVFYPLLVIGITVMILYYTGLAHTAFTSGSNLFQAGAIIAIGGLFLTPAGRHLATVALTGLIVFVIGIFALLIAMQHFGILRPPAIHPKGANIKHTSAFKTNLAGHKKHQLHIR